MDKNKHFIMTCLLMFISLNAFSQDDCDHQLINPDLASLTEKTSQAIFKEMAAFYASTNLEIFEAIEYIPPSDSGWQMHGVNDKFWHRRDGGGSIDTARFAKVDRIYRAGFGRHIFRSEVISKLLSKKLDSGFIIAWPEFYQAVSDLVSMDQSSNPN